MKPNYTVHPHTFKDIPDFIVMDNFKPINEIHYYSWYGDTLKGIISSHTVAIFKIKPKTK